MLNKLRDGLPQTVQPEIFGGDAVERVGIAEGCEQRVGERLLQPFLRPEWMVVAVAVEVAGQRRVQGTVVFVMNLVFNELDVFFLVEMGIVLEPVRLRLRMFPLPAARQQPGQHHGYNQQSRQKPVQNGVFKHRFIIFHHCPRLSSHGLPFSPFQLITPSTSSTPHSRLKSYCHQSSRYF